MEEGGYDSITRTRYDPFGDSVLILKKLTERQKGSDTVLSSTDWDDEVLSVWVGLQRQIKGCPVNVRVS